MSDKTVGQRNPERSFLTANYRSSSDMIDVIGEQMQVSVSKSNADHRRQPAAAVAHE
jgi:hypothetical protein